MIIKTVSCSGPKETTDPKDLVELFAENPDGELGLRMTERFCAKGMPRYDWIQAIMAEMREHKIRASLHISKEWCEDFCNGEVAPEIADVLYARHDDGNPLFQRVQLNFLVNQHSVSEDKLTEVIRCFPQHRFILTYNNINKQFLSSLDVHGLPFDVIYDSSFGDGILPDTWQPPAFVNRLQGYAGGLSPENVQINLEKISTRLYPNTPIYIDAQKGLRDENNVFSVERAREFIVKAMQWKTHKVA